MHYKLRRFISVLVLIVTVLNGITFTNHKAYAAPTPSQVQDAINKFADAVGKFAAKDASENVGAITNFCNRLSGLTSVVSGVIGILQMTGVIKDPVLEMLGKIMDAVKDVQTTLDKMNHTLDEIVAILIRIQAAQQEIARNKKATRMSMTWNNFNTNYTEKLKTYVNEYQTKINAGIAEWWNQTSHEGVYVLMMKKYNEENPLTYSKQDYDKGFPRQSDINGDTISTDWSLAIPSEYMPDTHVVTFNVDTYRDDFKKIMLPKLEEAINDGKMSHYGSAAASDYSSLTEQDRKKMLESYADQVLNTEIYKIACKVMTDNTVWVAQVISNYMHYCDNILQLNSGVNAFLNYIFLTHAFEAEVSKDIETFCDGMTAQAGFYGQFALTCAGQDSLQTIATKEKIREYFVNTVLSLSERKSKAITGYQNYCYITGTKVDGELVHIASSIYIKRHNERSYDGCDVRSWTIKLPDNIVNSVYMQIIYKHYVNFPNGAKDFAQYLSDNCHVPLYGRITCLTQLHGVETFPFSEGIYMQAHQYIDKGQYFKDGAWYNIDVGTGEKVEQKYYHVHDKIMGDVFNLKTGTQSINTIVAARAFYGQTWWSWDYDQCYLFLNGIFNIADYKRNTDLEVNFSLRSNAFVLESQTLHNLTGDAADDPNNPFAAFDQISLTPGVSDFQGILYENKSKDITDVLLESESFTYTGQPIEPAVMVLCSDDIVSEDCYTVTYINNDIESGDAMIRVEGKGEYSGIITRRFRINSASDSDSPINYYTGSSGGCNAISGLGLALGLVFVFKKLRKCK